MCFEKAHDWPELLTLTSYNVLWLLHLPRKEMLCPNRKKVQKCNIENRNCKSSHIKIITRNPTSCVNYIKLSYVCIKVFANACETVFLNGKGLWCMFFSLVNQIWMLHSKNVWVLPCQWNHSKVYTDLTIKKV